VVANGLELVRSAHAELEQARHRVRVSYRLQAERGGSMLDDVAEEHLMRYFFPDELGSLLAASGFEMVAAGAFPDIDAPLSTHTWNALIVARAVGDAYQP
jgi:hypothetical protein